MDGSRDETKEPQGMRGEGRKFLLSYPMSDQSVLQEQSVKMWMAK